MAYLVAQLSIRLQVAPQAILDLDTEMFKMLIRVLNDEAKEVENASKSKRR